MRLASQIQNKYIGDMDRIYLLTFAVGKSYIGVTSGTVAHRIAQHANRAKNGGRSALYAAWRKYGRPSVATIGEYPREDVYLQEIRLIAEHGTQAPTGYNTVEGGKNPRQTRGMVRARAAKQRGKKLTDSHRAALSAAHRGIPNANKGKKRSPAERAKMRAGWARRLKAGYTRSPEVRERIRQARLKYWSDRRAKTDS